MMSTQGVSAVNEASCGTANIPLRLLLACALGEGTHQFSQSVENVLTVLGRYGFIDHHRVEDEPPPTIRWGDELNYRGLALATLTWACGASWDCWRAPGHVFSEETEGKYWLTQIHNYALRETNEHEIRAAAALTTETEGEQ